MARYLFIAVSIASCFSTTPVWAAQKLDANEMAFLQKAIQGQLAVVALGKLALKKASRKEVKDFGAEIIEDHQYASQELRELSAKEGIYLPVQLDSKHALSNVCQIIIWQLLTLWTKQAYTLDILDTNIER